MKMNKTLEVRDILTQLGLDLERYKAWSQMEDGGNLQEEASLGGASAAAAGSESI